MELSRRRGGRHGGRARGAAERTRRRAGRRARRVGQRVAHPHGGHGRGRRGAQMREWLDQLFEAAEMRAADAWAIEEQGVPSLELMERAGAGLARVTAAVAQPGPVRVVVGKGNNGGDGLVVARLLREDGYEVDVLAAADLSDLRGDARTNLERLPGDPPEPFATERLEGSGVVVDALLGTGFEGSPRAPLAAAIAAINAQDAPVVACDVPSGVNASTGEE